MRNTFFLILSYLILSPAISFAQNDDYYADDFLRYEDRTYSPNIKTVQFHIKGVPLSLSVIGLGNGE